MTRRDWLTIGGLTLAGACGRKKAHGYPGYALIATAGENSLAVVDLMLFRLVRVVPLNAPPTAVIPGAGDRSSYVLTPSNGSVHVVGANFNRVGSRKVADEITEIRLTSDGDYLVAVSAEARELIVIETKSLNVVRREKLRERPAGLDVYKTNHVAVSGDNGTVELFSLSEPRRWSTQIGSAGGRLNFRDDGKLLIAAKLRDRSLAILNVPDLRLLTELGLAMTPQNLCFKPDGGQLFVSGEGMDGVAIVFPYSLEVEQTVLAGRDPGAMACSDTYLFIANGSGSDVSVMIVRTRQVIGVVQVGQRPSFITITPDEQYALVLDEGSGDMAVIRVGAIRATDPAHFREKSAASLFTMLAVGEKPVHAAVVPRA
ncbi:MAG: hypothetical protein JOZ62_08825 [Acidobacteriaceae bacterium]|nr:hypothetical protein [Acidobacteriaceae bacterium]